MDAAAVKMDTADVEEHLLVAHDGPVMTITLNRPRQRNAITKEMISGIAAAARAAGNDDRTRAVLITSNGDDFCAGIDLVQSNAEQTKPRTGHRERRMQYGAHEMILELDALQVPVVAAVRGWAAGIGNMIALSADVVVATPSTKFWVPMVKRGFTPDSGNTWLLPRLVGLARAKEMVLRGEPVDGRQAVEWGLITRCVPEDELDSTAATLVHEFANAATVAIGLSKRLLHANLAVDLRTGLHNEAMHEELATRSDDFKEGMRSFVQRRTPDYTGR